MLGTTAGSVWTPKLDGTEVFYAPLWHPRTRLSPFSSFDRNRHVCTVTGAIWGKYGRAMDGNDYIDCGNNSALNFTSSSFTLIAWIYATTLPAADGVIMRRGADNTDGWGFLVVTTGRLYVILDQVGAHNHTYSGPGEITTGTWICVGAVRDAVTGVVEYKNGDLLAVTSEGNTDPVTSARTLKIGRDDGAAKYWEGTIGEVWAFDKALSASSMTRFYQSTKWRYQS